MHILFSSIPIAAGVRAASVMTAALVGSAAPTGRERSTVEPKRGEY